MLKTTLLMSEYEEMPLGMDEPCPRFSWILESSEENVLQTAYHIQVSLSQDFTDILWDSGRNQSDQSVFVEYEGENLNPCTGYYWRVRTWDNLGNESDWSEINRFETGLLADGIWDADFIIPEKELDPALSPGWYLKKTLSVRRPVSVRIYATALGVYSLLVNGCKTGKAEMAPGWTDYHNRLLYQTYNVTDLFQEGDNTIVFHLGAGWYKGDLAGWLGKRNVYGERNAVSCEIRIEYEDGSLQWVNTDSSWRSRPSPVLFSEIYHGELYDGRLYDEKWLRHPSDNETDGVEIFVGEIPSVTAQDGPCVEAAEVIEPAALLSDTKGRTILDFQQNLTGRVRFTVDGLAGDEVILKHGEILDSAGDLYTENLRSARQTVKYILSGDGVETYESCFSFQGFRYVLIESWPGEPKAEDFKAIVLHSRMERSGEFQCSESLLNQLHHNIRWGMKGNFLDIPTDCPQRDERLGWTGDAQVFIGTANKLYRSAAFFRKWLRDLVLEQLPDGGVPHVVPDVLQNIEEFSDKVGGSHSACGWADAAVICPWSVYAYYGDTRALEEHYHSMKSWIGYIENRAENGVLWNTGFHFGDWVALDGKEGSFFGATPNDFTATVFYSHSVDLTARTAAILGKKEEAKRYRSLYDAIVKAFQEEFFTPSGRLACMTQTAHVLALHFGLTPEKWISRTVNSLVDLVEEEGDHLTTGFLGTPYLCYALADNGRSDKAWTLLLQKDYPSWLYQVTKGATTIWEHWDGLKPDGSLWSANMNSFNHYAYGAVGDWLYSAALGLSLSSNLEEEPGYKVFQVKPDLAGPLSWVEGSLLTPYGRISLKWEKTESTVVMNLVVPCNTRARVYHPDGKFASIAGSGTYAYEFDLI